MPPFHGKNTASEKLTKIHGKCFSNFGFFIHLGTACAAPERPQEKPVGIRLGESGHN
jgi:hypothetical protein